MIYDPPEIRKWPAALIPFHMNISSTSQDVLFGNDAIPNYCLKHLKMSFAALMPFQIIVSTTLQDVMFGIDASPNYYLNHLGRCLVQHWWHCKLLSQPTCNMSCSALMPFQIIVSSTLRCLLRHWCHSKLLSQTSCKISGSAMMSFQFFSQAPGKISCSAMMPIQIIVSSTLQEYVLFIERNYLISVSNLSLPCLLEWS